ncbi:HK97 family phage prohead protease [Vibrio fortis]|uniref:HK97 family phage prohead protease n=1 Tax=Vibrio fortis TaxID=212667 RepID=UPI0038CD4BE7
MTIKTKHLAFEIKSVDPEAGTFEGYANTFGFKDHAGDNTQKGAFTKSLDEHKAANSMPAMLWQHKQDQPIGVWTEMYEDDHGLYAKGKLILEVQQAKEAYALMKAGALKGLSIGYITQKERYNSQTKENELHEVKLLETSIVTFACNEQSQVEVVKNRFAEEVLPTEREMEKALRELGLSRKQAKSFLVEGYKAFNENTAEQDKPAPVISINKDVSEKEANELLALLKAL